MRLHDLAGVARRVAHDAHPEGLLPSLAQETRRLLACGYTAVVIRDENGAVKSFIPAGPRAHELNGNAAASMDGLRSIIVATETGELPPGVLCAKLASGARAMGEMYAAGKQSFDDIDRSMLESLAAFAVEAVEMSRAIERERRATYELDQLHTLEDEFLNAISHEIRTPLTIVRGFAKTIEMHFESMSKADLRTAVEGLADGARRLEGILAEVLDFDRVRRRVVEAHRVPCRVDGLVRMMVAESECFSNRIMHVRSEPIVALIDPAKVERILDALLANVDRHTPPGTVAWVNVAGVEGGVLITVEDEGPGVPEDMTGEVVRPFRHATNGSPVPGAGLGLPIADEYARLHGGRVWVENRPEGGTKVSVWLPSS